VDPDLVMLWLVYCGRNVSSLLVTKGVDVNDRML
jgi:hypothetical protein